MAITINGSGTITGISAGGLPDGSVTAADLASSLDLSGKTVTLPSGVGGKILQVKESYSSTDVTGITSATLLTSVNITPSSSTSKMIIFGSVYAYAINNGNGIACLQIRHGSSAGTSGTLIDDVCEGSDANVSAYTNESLLVTHTPGNTNEVYYNLVQGKGSINTSSVSAFSYGIIVLEIEP